MSPLVREVPLICSAFSVQRIADGSKTQTRRILDESKLRVRLDRSIRNEWFLGMPTDMRIEMGPGTYRAKLNPHGAVSTVDQNFGLKPGEFRFVCRFAQGDTFVDKSKEHHPWTISPGVTTLLWVRETWAAVSPDEDWRPDHECNIEYRADTPNAKRAGGWDEMPDDADAIRWRSPIFMPRWASRHTLRVVRVRLERLHWMNDVDARAEGCPNGLEQFRHGWEQLHGPKSWDANPWVWMTEFERVANAVKRPRAAGPRERTVSNGASH